METNPYKSSSFIGHSLWLIPNEASRRAYQKIISETASDLGTLDFKPHITLVAAIMTSEADVVERTKALAQELSPIQFEFDSMSQKDAYFQCVFAKYQKTQQVMSANALARDYFPERRSDPEYMPHLSLVYGYFTEDEKIKRLLPDLEQKVKAGKSETLTIEVDTIEVWSTQGDVSEWYFVDSIPMGERTKDSPDIVSL